MDVGLVGPDFTRNTVGFLEGKIVEAYECPVEVGDEGQWLAWLTDENTQLGRGRDGLATALIEYWRAKNVEPPELGRAGEVASRALRAFEVLLCHRIADRLGDTADGLDALLADSEAPFGWLFPELRPEVSSVDLKKLVREIDHLMSLQALGLPTELLAVLEEEPADHFWLRILLNEINKQTAMQALRVSVEVFDGLPAELVEAWCARAVNSDREELQAHPQVVRVTLLGALCVMRHRQIADLLGQVLIGLLFHIRERAEQRFVAETADVPALAPACDGLLLELARAAVDRPDETVRAVVYPIASEEVLRQLMSDSEARAAARTRRTRAVLRGAYPACYRQLLKLMLTSLEFRCQDVGCWAIMAALGELVGDYTACWGSGRFYDSARNVPLDDVVPPEWQAAVVDREGRVERISYELCVLVSLRDLLCSRRIFLGGADQWGKPGGDRSASGTITRAVSEGAHALARHNEEAVTSPTKSGWDLRELSLGGRVEA